MKCILLLADRKPGSSTALLCIFDDILDYTKIDAGASICRLCSGFVELFKGFSSPY